MTEDFRIHFLIVDDQQSIRKLCVTIGASLGFSCDEAESAEAAHLWAIVLTIPYLAYAGISHQWTALLLFAAAHLGVNVYPVLHLRLVRGRLQQVLARKRARPRPPERVRPTH